MGEGMWTRNRSGGELLFLMWVPRALFGLFWFVVLGLWQLPRRLHFALAVAAVVLLVGAVVSRLRFRKQQRARQRELLRKLAE